jgi:cellulose synthase/poly-beta-1,6-N-acetylglucosamine synthase-like glycosyltransferase
METLFIISVAFIAYTYVGYPIVLAVWSALLPRRVEKRYRTVPVSVVIAAKDEEINIKARIENLLDQEYPQDMLEIIVVSDGSTDRTVEVARRFDRVRVLESRTSVGKAGALNIGVKHASHGIVVFADARQRFDSNVIAELVSLLADDRVGAVSGELILEPSVSSVSGGVQDGVGLYWRYEKLIRRGESAVASVVGATGSIYAIRREQYVPLEPHALLDDLLVPMRIVMAGHRVVFSRSARAYDLSSTTAAQEFARKVRTLAGNFQAMVMEPRLMSPATNPVFFQFVSHKLLRLAVPYFCIAALFSSAMAPGPVFAWLFRAQVVFYLAGLLALTPLSRTAVRRLLRVPWTFVVLNAAAVAALWVFATGRDRVVWKRTPTA